LIDIKPSPRRPADDESNLEHIRYHRDGVGVTQQIPRDGLVGRLHHLIEHAYRIFRAHEFRVGGKSSQWNHGQQA
jgi:hypothetical protein